MPSNLRLALLSLHSCPLGQLGTRDTGGMNVYVRELARELGALGHRVDIFTRAHDPRDDQVEWPSQNVRLVHIRAGRVEDMGKLAQYEHLADFTANLDDFLARDGARYDLVHSNYWLSGVVGQHLAAQQGAPHVLMLHTVGAIKNRLPVGEAEPQVRLATERALARGCTLNIVPTAREKGLLAGLYGVPPARIAAVPCGVDSSLFRPLDREHARCTLGFAPAERIALCVGRIEPLKGLDKLVAALALLPGLRLLILGGDEHSQGEVARLAALADKLGLGARIGFPGTVPQGRLPLYYSAADLTVVPSYYESFSLVMLESLACGTPVVATDVGVAPQVLHAGQTGLVVPDNSPARLAQAMRVVLAGEVSSPAAIRQEVSRFTWPRVARLVARQYEAVLARQPLPVEVSV